MKALRPIDRIQKSLRNAKSLQEHLNAFVILQDEDSLERQVKLLVQNFITRWHMPIRKLILCFFQPYVYS